MDKKLKQGIKVLFSPLPFIEKCLHFCVLLGVLSQLISSSLIHVHGDTPLDKVSDLSFIHIYTGIVLFPLGMIFAIKVIMRRKLSNLYPWLFRQFQGIKTDIGLLLTFKLPEPKPSGLAATVEGLGLLALLAALITGVLWYVVLQFIGPNEFFLSFHKFIVTFIELFFYGHGLFALLHFTKWWQSKNND